VNAPSATRARVCRLALCACLLAVQAHALTTKEFNERKVDFLAHEQVGDWDQAANIAQSLVDESRQTADKQPLRLAEALCLLGDVSLDQGNYAIAEPQFIEALGLVEKHATPGSGALVQPLTGLGEVQAGMQRNDEAIATLNRALLLSRRNSGLFDAAQVEILRVLNSTFINMRRFGEASAQMDYLERVAEHAYGPDDPRMSDILNEVARYYSQIGETVIARFKYMRAIDIVERKVGKNDPMLVPSLRGIADTYVSEMVRSRLDDGEPPNNESIRFGLTDPTPNLHRPPTTRDLNRAGLDGLKRALTIIEARPLASPQLLAGTLINIGDWYTIVGDAKSALPFYQRVLAMPPVQAEEKTQDKEDGRNAPLGSPVRIFYPIPRLSARNLDLPASEVDEKFVQLEYTVTSEGTVIDEHIVAEDASNLQVSEALGSIKATRYRPKFVDGKPVDVPGISYRQVFRVKKP
jgi:tetratricopeptide (TPR) repeat protein